MEVGPNLTVGSTGTQPEHIMESQRNSISSKRLNEVNIRHSFKPDDIILASSGRSDTSAEASGPPSPREGDIRNFGEIMLGMYRSSFPGSCNLEHLESLKLKTLITLVTTPFEPQVEQWLASKNVKHYRIKIQAHKTSEDTVPMEAIAQVMKLLTDETKRPILMHCNKGKHRTGCMVACFRKLQGMDDVSAITEYHEYARPKARAFDVAFISKLRSEDVFKAMSSLRSPIEQIWHHHHHHDQASASDGSISLLEKERVVAIDGEWSCVVDNSQALNHQLQQTHTNRAMFAPEPPLSPAHSAGRDSGLSVDELVDALSRIEDRRNKGTLTPPTTPSEEGASGSSRPIDGTV